MKQGRVSGARREFAVLEGLLVATLVTGCKATTPEVNEVPASTASAPSAAATASVAVPCDTTSTQVKLLDGGLAPDEQRDFLHLAEGSEVFPVPFLLALRNADGSKFLDVTNPGYGLLAHLDDPTSNPHRLPIGMTAAPTLDEFGADLEMFGFNCAACHVGQLVAQGTTYRILGAPNLFDIQSFLVDLTMNVKGTLTDIGRLLQFVKDLGDGPTFVNGDEQAVRLLRRTLPTKEQLESGGDEAKALYERLVQIQQDELKKDIPLEAGLKLRSKAGPTAPHPGLHGPRPSVERPKLGHVARSPDVALDRLEPEILRKQQATILGDPLLKVVKSDTASAVLARHLPGLEQIPLTKRAEAMTSLIGDFERNVRLLKQRLTSLMNLGRGAEGKHTAGGAGRIDAFMSARNSIFTKAKVADLTSPVDYPKLFNVKNMRWFHWDANTTSFTERNVGQAIGLGAVVDPDTSVSTIRLGNIYRLEAIAEKLASPKWPFAMPEPAQVQRGQQLFSQKCASCHGENSNGNFEPYQQVGTDDRRAVNFAQKVDDKEFAQAIHDVIARVVQQAIEYEHPPNPPNENVQWRTTLGYVHRSLEGVWASAPFLHNGSIPSLSILLGIQERPAMFFIGNRGYDPAGAGYCTTQAPGSTLRDTSIEGNKNTGHDGYTAALQPDDRVALLAYLKTL